ncbi:MAG: hypothetical protein WCG78_06555 [Candidatus Omnitrophota bacterium]
MTTLREMFHGIANWHNKITVAAGCTREILKDTPFDAMSREELKTEHEKLLQLLDKFENDAINANRKVLELKEAIYSKLGPDTAV